jgi:heme-degrading monooxygenase HmoA
MFARHVTMVPKGNSASELTRIIEKEIIPRLSNQKGFREEITFVSPEGLEAIAISLWDTKEDAEAYSETGYLEVLKALSKVVEGTPRVRIFEVTSSTFENVAARAVA